ncbi:alpha/beta fold hydrolase [Sorangium sp. So ce1078]|uniref:alpha/beta fold hydrolase n=1 Tax=Sorangium sp. So ce1078 TaxID=3133329 RepID=UPI003F624DAC
MSIRSIISIAAACVWLATGACTASVGPSRAAPANAAMTYQSVAIDGVHVFYREAGRRDAPTILLLHGFPSSSRMYDSLMRRLADQYHLVAPDYPGFGHSDAPPPSSFRYTFDHLAEVIDALTQKLGLSRYILFVQDYGGPVGFRLALAHPERVRAIVVQNAVAHEEGLGPLWEPRKAYWADRAGNEAKLRANLLSFEATRLRHVGKSPHPERYDPDTWADEFAFLSRPGQIDIQSDLFYDYRTNVASYPRWQAYLREHKPPLLVIWGKYDPSFALAGAEAYRRDVPDAEIHLVEGGHFAMDEAGDEVVALTREFLTSRGLDRQ